MLNLNPATDDEQVSKGLQPINEGTIGCTPNRVPMVFILFSRDSWGL